MHLRHHAKLVPVLPDESLVAASIGPSGELIALWSGAEGYGALTSRLEQPGWASFPNSRTEEPVSARVTYHTPERTRVLRLSELPIAHPHIQPMPAGGLLLVGARCRWRPEGAERNAIHIDADGDTIREATLGDGIEDIKVTLSGEVWVGYFDEGIYGNYGWGRPGSPEPIGASGIVQFNAHLEPAWHCPYPVGVGPESLNLIRDAVWARDGSILRISERQAVWWTTTTDHARTLIAEGTTVALVSGYRDQMDRVLIGQVGSGDFTIDSKYRINFPDDRPLTAEARVIGRGPELHVVTATDWYRLDLDDFTC